MTGPASSVADQGLCRPSIPLLCPVTRVSRLLVPDQPPNVVHPQTPSRIETTSSNSQTPADLPPQRERSACRSIRPPSNATFVQRSSHVHTTFDPISGPIPMSDLLFAMCAPKPSPASMIGKDTKAFIAARRSLSAEASLAPEVAGAVAGGSLVLTLWAGISEAKPVASASSLCWTKKPWNASAIWTSK